MWPNVRMVLWSLRSAAAASSSWLVQVTLEHAEAHEDWSGCFGISGWLCSRGSVVADGCIYGERARSGGAACDIASNTEVGLRLYVLRP